MSIFLISFILNINQVYSSSYNTHGRVTYFNKIRLKHKKHKNLERKYEHNNQYYLGQQNGHRYVKGTPVQCNDFNGPLNFTHKYWGKNKHRFYAIINFLGSDCQFNMKKYGCISSNSGDMFMPKHMYKCKGLRRHHPTNCSIYKRSKISITRFIYNLLYGMHLIRLHWPKF